MAAFPLVNNILLAAGVGLVLSSMSWMHAATYMPQRSAKGRALYQTDQRYERFINGAESYRQQFYEKKNLFNEILLMRLFLVSPAIAKA